MIVHFSVRSLNDTEETKKVKKDKFTLNLETDV